MAKPAVKEYLTKFPPEIRNIISALRTAARKNMPGAKEIIYHDALGYSTSGSPYDRICYIAPQSKGYVNFGFFFGGGLPDPKKLLIGEGKRLRHVKLRSVEEAKDPALAKLIAATWKRAPKSVASIHKPKKA